MKKYFLLKLENNYPLDEANFTLSLRKKKSFLKYIQFENEMIEKVIEIFELNSINKVAYIDRQSPHSFDSSRVVYEGYDKNKLKAYLNIIFRHDIPITIVTNKTKSIDVNPIDAWVKFYSEESLILKEIPERENFCNRIYQESSEVQNFNF